jgi:beta-1,4-mannosyl-glycoprotein beta-1,4-N-acetylglucosaminyltransferase
MRVIFDCFPFFQEVDMITLRIETLKDAGVFAFIGVESSLTHAGYENPTIIPSIIERIDSDWRNWSVNHPETPVLVGKGITSFTIESTYWHPHKNIVLCRITEHDRSSSIAATRRREMRQRNALIHALGLYYTPLSHDLIMISDVDEIPNPDILLNLQWSEFIEGMILVFEQRLCYYNVNTSPSNNNGYIWMGTRIAQMSDVLAMSPHIIRYGIAMPDSEYPQTYLIPRAGWHLSYFGGESAVKRKMTHFLHQELNPEEHTKHIEKRIRKGEDPWGRENFVVASTTDVPPPMLHDTTNQWKHFWYHGFESDPT